MPTGSVTRTHWIQRRVEAFVNAQRHAPEAIRVLAEGDSWFTHPTAAWKGKSVIGHLDGYKTVNVVSLASPGDTLDRYPDPPNGQWRLACHPDWLAGETYDAVLISGGGNDILADRIDALVRDKADHPQRHGRALIEQSCLRQTLDEIREHIERIRGTVDFHLGPDRPVFMHGYSHARPSGREFELLGGLISLGPWIQGQLADLNIDDRDEQQDIVNALVDEFNLMLGRLQATMPNFIHVDVRSLLGPDDWDDEIHPNGPARRRLARHFRKVLVDYF